MNAEELYRFRVPRRLDDPPKIFMWAFDSVMIFMVFFLFGLITGLFGTFTAIGAGVTYAYSKIKAGRTRGYGIHLLYWHLPITLGMRRTPASAVRHFQG